jgi:hypothetical protein
LVILKERPNVVDHTIDAYRQVHNLSLIIQPGDSFFPFVDAIDSAAKTIKLTIFRMDDPIVLGALKRAVDRQVAVQALVAGASKGWTKRNKKLVDDLSRLGVDVRTPKAPHEKLKRYHYKVLMADDVRSLILTFNPTQKNLHYARDFGLVLRDQTITTELPAGHQPAQQPKQIDRTPGVGAAHDPHSGCEGRGSRSDGPADAKGGRRLRHKDHWPRCRVRRCNAQLSHQETRAIQAACQVHSHR